MSTPLPPAPDLRSGINAITVFAFVLFVIRLWYSLDPQPDPIAVAIEQASTAKMEAYIVVIAIAFFGLWMILRFIVSAIVNGLASQAAGWVSWLCIINAAVLLATVVAPLTMVLLAGSVMASMGVNWAVEAIRSRRASG